MDERLFFTLEESVSWAQSRVVASCADSEAWDAFFSLCFDDLPALDAQNREEPLMNLALLVHVFYAVLMAVEPQERAAQRERLERAEFSELLEHWRVLAFEMQRHGDERLMAYGVGLCTESIARLCLSKSVMRSLPVQLALQMTMALWKIIAMHAEAEASFVVHAAMGCGDLSEPWLRRVLAVGRGPVSLQMRRLEQAHMDGAFADLGRGLGEVLYPYFVLGCEDTIRACLSFAGHMDTCGDPADLAHLPYRVLCSVLGHMSGAQKAALAQMVAECRACATGQDFDAWLAAQGVLEEALSLFLRADFANLLAMRCEAQTQEQVAVFSYFRAMAALCLGRRAKASSIMNKVLPRCEGSGLGVDLCASMVALRAYLLEQEKLPQLASDTLLTSLHQGTLSSSNALYLAALCTTPESIHKAINQLAMAQELQEFSPFYWDRIIEIKQGIARSALVAARYASDPLPLLECACEYGELETLMDAILLALCSGGMSEVMTAELGNLSREKAETLALYVASSDLEPEQYQVLFSLAEVLRDLWPQSLGGAVLVARALSQDPLRALDHIHVVLDAEQILLPSASFLSGFLQMISALSEYVGDAYAEASLISKVYQHFGAQKEILYYSAHILSAVGARGAAAKAAFMDQCGAQGFLELLEVLKTELESTQKQEEPESRDAPRAADLVRGYPLLISPPLLALPLDAYMCIASRLIQRGVQSEAAGQIPKPQQASWEYHTQRKASDAFEH